MRGIVPLAAVITLAAAGCSDPASPPYPVVGSLATVEWSDGTPMLFLQSADGTDRLRVHFDSVLDTIPGNIGPRITDSTLLTIKRMKWSPDGQHLAVVASASFGADQIILVSAAGRALRTVSINTQVIWSDVEWSPDSRKIVYVMSTQILGGQADLFMTDLTTDAITRLTVGQQWTGYDVFRVDLTGSTVHYLRRLGWAPDSVNGRSLVGSVNIATGDTTAGLEIVGDPEAIAHSGGRIYFTRWSEKSPGQRELVTRPILFGEGKILDTGDLGHAVLLDNDQEIILGVWHAEQAEFVFQLMGVSGPNDVHAILPTTSGTTWTALWRGELVQ